MFIDGENGENFMSILGFSQYSIGTFPKMWEEKRPTIDKYVLQKLNELEQDIKDLKEELEKLKGYRYDKRI